MSDNVNLPELTIFPSTIFGCNQKGLCHYYRVIHSIYVYQKISDFSRLLPCNRMVKYRWIVLRQGEEGFACGGYLGGEFSEVHLLQVGNEAGGVNH